MFHLLSKTKRENYFSAAFRPRFSNILLPFTMAGTYNMHQFIKTALEQQ